MATPTSDKLKFYFASKYLASDGDTMTEFVADAGGTVRTIVDAALTEADDYWNGAVGWFAGDTTTAALQGQVFHVRDFTASSDTLTLAQDLPAAPAAGDTYHLILGGNYRGDIQCFGMLADGDQPEHTAVTGTNITGLTITYLSGLLDTGTLSIFYDQSEDTLQLKMDSEDYGATLDVSGDVSDGILYGSDGEKYAVVDVTNGSLPGGDQTDTWTISYPSGTFIGDLEAYETGSGSNITRYALAVLHNSDGSNNMTDLVVWPSKPAGSDTAVASGETLGTTAGTVEVDDASDHPATSYWIYNVDEDDVRFVTSRSGNVLSCAAAGAGLRGKTAASWDAADVIKVYPDFDIGLDAPSTNQYESPTDENTAPSGVTFSAPLTAAAGLSVGSLASGNKYGVWYRVTIIDGTRGRTGFVYDLNGQWS